MWFLFKTPLRTAAENMATDEALLEFAALWARPVLRLYGWSEPAASFGYFQRYRDVATLTRLRPLVRRPTGGGVVPHDADWTYSLVFPPSAPWYALKAVESYRRVHEWVQASFARAGFATQLASAPSAPATGQCFVGAEQFDVVWNRRKIAGAAQRRNKQGLLIQGSIQPPAIARAQWETAFLQVADARWEPLAPDRAFDDRVRELVLTKYSQDSYNQRR